jgi:hypothetical protein
LDSLEIGWKGVNWITLAQDRDKWWAFVSKVMKFLFYKYKEFSTG